MLIRLGALGDEKLPRDLMAAQNIELKAWFQTRFEQSKSRLGTNPHTLHNSTKKLEELQAQLAQLEVQHLEERTNARDRHIKNESNFLDRVFSVFRH